MEYLEDIKNYWTIRAEGYSRSVLEELEKEKVERHLSVIRRYAGDRKPLDILDIGCGPGFFPILMGKEGHNVTAVDYTETMLEMAKSNSEKFGINCTFMRMDAQGLDFEDGSFDLILSRNLIWDLEKPRKAYEEWLRVLKPGGKMIIFDGNYYLHLHDENYAKIESKKDVTKSHSNLMGVDTNIIKEIARNLPLSKEHRPQWDVNTLVELGAKAIHVETHDSSKVETAKGMVSLPHSFLICAEK
jgi:SAM-dependent methyltransferase